jgi:glutathione S-transferase
VAKANGLDLEFVETENNANAEFNKSAEYRKLNPQGKIPTFVGANGFVLTESIAIAIYGTFGLLVQYSRLLPSSAEYSMMMCFFYTFSLSLAEIYC